MDNVPSGSENMWVYRDESSLGRMVAVLYRYQFIIGVCLVIWAYLLNKEKLRGIIEKWKKRTE
jgi:hypothetical protein